MRSRRRWYSGLSGSRTVVSMGLGHLGRSRDVRARTQPGGRGLHERHRTVTALVRRCPNPCPWPRRRPADGPGPGAIRATSTASTRIRRRDRMTRRLRSRAASPRYSNWQRGRTQNPHSEGSNPSRGTRRRRGCERRRVGSSRGGPTCLHLLQNGRVPKEGVGHRTGARITGELVDRPGEREAPIRVVIGRRGRAVRPLDDAEGVLERGRDELARRRRQTPVGGDGDLDGSSLDTTGPSTSCESRSWNCLGSSS